mmetsp:Transcript_17353/g.32920  ORF Transcript_17353/g.32920 Transcript_17353/m.32920 type:complete len:210 (+) Transcript_17353:204-833(+)
MIRTSARTLVSMNYPLLQQGGDVSKSKRPKQRREREKWDGGPVLVAETHPATTTTTTVTPTATATINHPSHGADLVYACPLQTQKWIFEGTISEPPANVTWMQGSTSTTTTVRIMSTTREAVRDNDHETQWHRTMIGQQKQKCDSPKPLTRRVGSTTNLVWDLLRMMLILRYHRKVHIIPEAAAAAIILLTRDRPRHYPAWEERPRGVP